MHNLRTGEDTPAPRSLVSITIKPDSDGVAVYNRYLAGGDGVPTNTVESSEPLLQRHMETFRVDPSQLYVDMAAEAAAEEAKAAAWKAHHEAVAAYRLSGAPTLDKERFKKVLKLLMIGIGNEEAGVNALLAEAERQYAEQYAPKPPETPMAEPIAAAPVETEVAVSVDPNGDFEGDRSA